MFRIDRYHKKLDFIEDKISNLPQDLEIEYMIDALYHRIQISVEAMNDVISMLCKDLGLQIEDDYSNIDELENLNIFPDEFLNEIRRLNGLRNVLVHRYNKIEEDLIVNEKDHFVEVLKKFIKIVEKLINEQLKLPE